jgi:hypothetical protein
MSTSSGLEPATFRLAAQCLCDHYKIIKKYKFKVELVKSRQLLPRKYRVSMKSETSSNLGAPHLLISRQKKTNVNTTNAAE